MNQWSHRKSQTVLQLCDAQGLPMAGQKVEVELKKHEFLFGCGVFWAVQLADPATPAEKRAYLEKLWEAWSELFN